LKKPESVSFSTSFRSFLFYKYLSFIIRIESHNVNGRTTFGQSLSINDDNGRLTNKKTEDDDADDDNNEKKLYKSYSNINDNSKNINLGIEQIHKTSSGSNIFSRLMHSEPHVQ